MDTEQRRDQLVNDLLSNRSGDALLRDAEQGIADTHPAIVPLCDIPVSEWDRCVGHDVTLPPELEKFFSVRLRFYEGRPEPLMEQEIHRMEEQVEKFHNVKPPYYIAMSLTLQRTGRPWLYVADAGLYLTGLTLGKE